MAAAKNNKPTELTDIPLTLDQGDSVELNAAKSEKLKTNSLKRFFRSSKSGMPTSKSTESSEAGANPDQKSPRSLHMRFGSFHKADAPNDTEAGSSAELPKSKSTTESRLSLQGRLSTYWTNVFRKSSKKPSTTEVKPPEVDAPPPIEQNQSENL